MKNTILDSFFDRLDKIDFRSELEDLFSRLCLGANKLGRALSRQMLCLYYTLKEGDLKGSEKIWIYMALLYVLIPGDLIPRRVFHLLGLTDDLAALAYVIQKVKRKVTPEIMAKVEKQLDDWFGYEIKSSKNV